MSTFRRMWPTRLALCTMFILFLPKAWMTHRIGGCWMPARPRGALVTLDTDFANILVYPPKQFAGLIVLRPGVQTHAAMKEAAARVRQLLKSESVTNRLWIVEDRRIRVFESD